MIGEENAMVNLGLLEMKELNLQEAAKWITRAAEKGNHVANELIEEYNLRKVPTEVDPKVCYFSPLIYFIFIF
jgi:hypothetical protein